MEAAELKLKRPLVFFDLETTGVDVEKDRIVQIAVLRLEPGPDPSIPLRFEDVWLVNPGMPIPAVATAIHGIEDDTVTDMPHFCDVAEGIKAVFWRADVCGHNALRFDVPLLENEMKRAEIQFEIEGDVIDTLRIFQARFRHTLECAHRLYAGSWFSGAHDAGNDVDALEAVLLGMLEEHPDLPREPGELARTPPSPDYVDMDGKFVWVGDEVVFAFGEKTRGRTLRSVAKDDRGFLEWMLSKDFPEDTLRVARRALKGEFPERGGSTC